MTEVEAEKELESQTDLSCLTNEQLCQIIISRGGTAREDAWQELQRRQPTKQDLIFLCQRFIKRQGKRQGNYAGFIDRRAVPVLARRNDLTYQELKELLSIHSLDKRSKEQLGTMFFETPEVSQSLTEEDLFDLILYNRDAREKAWQVLTEKFLSKPILIRLFLAVDDRNFLASKIWPLLKTSYDLSIEELSDLQKQSHPGRAVGLEILQMRARKIRQLKNSERSEILEKKPRERRKGGSKGRPRRQRDDLGDLEQPIVTPDDEPPVGDLYPPGYGPEE